MFSKLFWKHGERLQMWINKLKIAIIEKNTEAIDGLLDDIPELDSAEEIEEAVYLLREAAELIHTLKNETSQSMRQIKKNIDFLRSTDVPTSSKLDIKS